jgi:WD40 repeat protein
MTHQHMPFDHERIDDEIDEYSRGADSDLPLESADARLLTDLRRMYRSGEEDARSLDRVYARLRTQERTHERGRGAGSLVADTASSSRLTQKGWQGIITATDTSSPVPAETARRSQRPYLTTGIAILLVVALLIGSFWIFTGLRARNTSPQILATPTQQSIQSGKLVCSASFDKNYDLVIAAHPGLDWSANGKLAFAHPYLRTAFAQTCVADPVSPINSPVNFASRPSWSPDGRRLLALTMGGIAGDTGHVLDTATGRELAVIHTEPGQSFEQAVWTADGTQIVAIVLVERQYRNQDNPSPGPDVIKVQVWNASTGVLVRTAMPNQEAWRGSGWLAPNGAYLAMLQSDERIQIWDLATGQLASVSTDSLKTDSTSVSVWTWAPDGVSFAIGVEFPFLDHKPSEVRIYATATGQRTAMFPDSDAGEAAIGALAWSPDGKYLAESSGAIQIWDVEAQKVVATFGKIATKSTSSDGKTSTSFWIAALAWAPDSRGLASITGSSDIGSARPDQMTNTLNVWRLS